MKRWLLVVINRVQTGKLTFVQNAAYQQAVRKTPEEHDVTCVLDTPKTRADTLAAPTD